MIFDCSSHDSLNRSSWDANLGEPRRDAALMPRWENPSSDDVSHILRDWPNCGVHLHWDETPLLVRRASHAIVMLQDSVEVDAERRGGVPVVKGTRFKVSQLIAEIADSEALSEVCDDFDLDEELARNILHALSISLDRPF